MISIPMLKICGKSVVKPVLIIYKKCLEKGCFPNKWKKANVILVHTTMTNYRPISLLSICGKFLERLLYNSMFELFIQNNLITSNQSGFKTSDLTRASTNISITHKIWKSFDDGYKVRVLVLDISKAFDKVWH